jgi:drug/metabolite transporter (DMT)-like permease
VDPSFERPSRAWTVHAALLFVQVAFASQAVEAKIAMLPRAKGGEEIFPEALAIVRMIGGALFFQAVLAARGTMKEVSSLPLGKREHTVLLGLSVLGIAANQALFLYGLRWTTPVSVALLGATIPVFAAALAVLFGKEKLGIRTVLGIASAFAGVVSLTGVSSFDRGAALVALNSLSYAAYVVLSRDVVRRIGALRVMAWVFLYGAILFAPLGMPALVAQVPLLTARGWAFLAYIVLFPTIGAYFANAWALGRSSATLVTVYIYLQPLLAGLLAWVQMHEPFTLRAAIASVFILGGVGIVTSAKRVK